MSGSVATPPIRKITIQQNVRKSGGSGLFSRLRRRFRRPRGPGRKNPKKGLKEILTYVGIVAAALFFAGTISMIAMFAWVAGDLPDPDNIAERILAETTKIYDRTGETILYEIHGAQKRTIVELEDISPHVIDATISAEDKNFYEHSGFSIKGYARAFLKNLLKQERAQGGSTITQQFIKNSILSPEKTYTRKLKELVLAFEMERRFSKDQILKLYLNEIPYGSVTYGIESAAQTFLGKKARDLTISESALLASLPKATTYYSPYGTHGDELIHRSHLILDTMANEGYITPEEAEEAKDDDVLARILPRKENILAPHFVFYVREILAEEFGEQMVERGGLKVITTLDVEKQTIAENAISENLENLENWGASTAALLALDPKNGDIVSMIGSVDYFNEEIDGKFNALLGLRQPGSSIKPMVYAAAFDKGYTQDTVLYDVVTTFRNDPEDYTPNNYDFVEHGPVTIREALAGSLNIPAVKVLYLTGIDYFLDFAAPLGYTTFNQRHRFGLSLVLGGGEVRPIEHISAFTAFARDGMIVPPRAVLKVEDSDGNVLMDNDDEPKAKRVMDKEVVRKVTDIMSDNNARAFVFGESNYLTLGGRPVAAKTGTTNGFKDAWTIGFTPSLVAGVWTGNAEGGEMKTGADGSKVAAPIWNAFMRTALEKYPFENFPEPEPVVTGKGVLDGEKNAQTKVRIDRYTGKLATEHTPDDYVIEQGFGVPHSILFFVDKGNPRGPVPENPENDRQFENWEAAVAKWAGAENFIAEDPPTEYDDVHLPENEPEIEFTALEEGSAIEDRTFHVQVSTNARRGVSKVEYAMDGETFSVLENLPFSRAITIPNRFGKGFHILTAVAYDDVGNRGSTSVTINLTAEPGPIGVQWSAPWSGQSLYARNFPFTIKISIDDPKSIKTIDFIAVGFSSGERIHIGTIADPALPNMGLQWKNFPDAGRYDLTIEAELTSGDSRSESITVYVR